MLSLGVPMFVMGDEVRRTQSGNNNAYCQDNETSWFDWRLLERHAGVHRFVSMLIARRLLRDIDHERQRVSLNQLIRRANMHWHGVKLGEPDWASHSHSLALEAEVRQHGLRVYIIMNWYLGFTGIRTAAILLAPMDRYVTQLAARHGPVADCPLAVRSYLSRGSALRSGVVWRKLGGL